GVEVAAAERDGDRRAGERDGMAVAGLPRDTEAGADAGVEGASRGPEAQAAFAADLGAKQRRDVVAEPAEGGGDVIAVRVLYSDRRRRDPGSGARRRDERAMARDRLVERESGNNVRRRED